MKIDGAIWISKNWEGAREFSDEAISSVASFTLLWSYFEDHFFEKNFKLEKIQDFTDQCYMQTELVESLDEQWIFFRDRYFTNGSCNFYKLFTLDDSLPKGSSLKAYKKVLVALETNNDVMYAVLVIVYRIRNNLFHGNKPLETLNEQVSLLENAYKALMVIMEKYERT